MNVQEISDHLTKWNDMYMAGDAQADDYRARALEASAEVQELLEYLRLRRVLSSAEVQELMKGTDHDGR